MHDDTLEYEFLTFFLCAEHRVQRVHRNKASFVSQ